MYLFKELKFIFLLIGVKYLKAVSILPVEGKSQDSNITYVFQCRNTQ